MNYRDLFGVILRTIGIGCLIHASWYAPGIVTPATTYTSGDYLVPTAIDVGVGALLLFRADWIVLLSYPSRRRGLSRVTE